jgi:signal transduction histidine kinase/ligand-binding sensor domain-containing protein
MPKALSILLFLAFSLAAQSADMRFDHLTSEQGLSQNSVLCILQDQRGFLWFGTEDGLNKYDGYKFTVYRSEPHDTNSLSDSYITAQCEDQQGSLWIGTKDGGLNQLDLKTGRIKQWKHDPEDSTSLSSNYVLSIYMDRSGILWCGTYAGGLNKFDQNQGSFKRWKNDPDNPNSLSNNYIYDIIEDFKGNLWLATYNGLCRLDPQVHDSGNFTNYFYQPTNSRSLSNSRIWSLFETEHPGDTLLWIGTESGLNLYQRKTDNFLRFYPNPRNLNHFNNSINSISVFSAGEREVLWLGTYNGLFGMNISAIHKKTDRQGLSIHGYFHEIDDPQSLSENVISALYQDRSGIFWIGTYGGGVNKYSRKKQKFKLWTREAGNPNSLSNKGVWAITETEENMLWIGTTEGLNLLNLKSGQIRCWFCEAANPNSISADYISALCSAKSGELWLGTYGGGLSRMTWKNHNTPYFKHWKADPNRPGGLTHNFILSLYQDKSGLLWIGTWGGGLNQMDPATEKIQYWMHDPSDPHSLSFDDVWCIYEDRQGNLWIGTYGGGLNLFDREKRKFTHWKHDANNPNSLSNNTVYSIYQSGNDSVGTLWIGTGGGLNRLEQLPTGGNSDFEPSDIKFSYYREKDGLPNNVIYGILEDQHGYLWLSTNNGISRFDPKTETFKNYDIHDGLQSNEFNSDACFKSSSGMMFFGGVNGLNGFYPDSLEDNNYLPAVVLTDFQLFNRPVSLGRDSPLQKPIWEAEEITLSYKQNIFSFEFAALDFTAPVKNHYAYKMVGFEEDWNYVSDRRFAAYTGLPSGEYTFKVIGSNNDGVWNQQGTSINIIVNPPPWRTWWAYTFYVLIILSAVVAWRRYDLRKRRRKLEEHLQKEREAAELREAKLRAESAEYKTKVIQAEQEMEKQHIRNRIASDLHDEIGSNLSSIKLISELVQNSSNLDEESRQYFSDIYQAANASSESIRDIVWFINPGSDELSKLIAKMKETANAMLKNIAFDFQDSNIVSNQKINPEIRRNIFLIYKEILNNIIKHSGAKKVEIELQEKQGNIQMSIKDNGCGFETETAKSGQGLKNMQNRVSQMNGNIDIESHSGKGTHITLEVKMA